MILCTKYNGFYQLGQQKQLPIDALYVKRNDLENGKEISMTELIFASVAGSRPKKLHLKIGFSKKNFAKYVL